jgi:hypothetical protein
MDPGFKLTLLTYMAVQVTFTMVVETDRRR